jgi:A/G-specific adenine glycosylase
LKEKHVIHECREQTAKIVAPLLEWFSKQARILPWRENPTAYRVWISEIMLQQTRVEAVKPYYERFMKRLPNIQALSDVPEDELLKLWEGLGYYNRARNLQKAARFVVEKYEGKLPEDYYQLLELPGIGSYTAGAIFSIAFNKKAA